MEHIGVIGGLAVDLEGRPHKKLIPADSNPGTVKVSWGGVGRNIAENLYRMGGNKVSFFSAVGTDVFGSDAAASLQELGLDVNGILALPACRTATYLSILDENGEMVLALSDMEVLERITPEHVEAFAPLLDRTSLIVLDANLSEETLACCGRVFSERRIFIDPVSVEKARRIRPVLPFCHALKPNLFEAEALTGISIQNEGDLEEAGGCLLDLGVKMVFISLGKNGVFYMDRLSRGRLPAPEITHPASVTGAGDAMSAAIADGIARDSDILRIAGNALRAANITLQSKEPVNPDLATLWAR